MAWAILWLGVALAVTWWVEQAGHPWRAAAVWHGGLLLLVGFVAGAHYWW